MSNLYVSILVLAAYLMACVGWWARHKQLDRRRASRNRVRRINAYTMSGSVVSYPVRPANVVDLDNYSRKVGAA